MFDPAAALARILNKHKETYDIKESKQEETLEEWKLDVENKFLKVRGNKVNEDPYVTYFFKYCQCCYDFRPGACFHESGIIKSENMLECSELRVNIKKLDNI